MLRTTFKCRSCFLSRKTVSLMTKDRFSVVVSHISVSKSDGVHMLTCPLSTGPQLQNKQEVTVDISTKLSKLVHKIERLGKENKMGTLSHLLSDTASDGNLMDKLLELSLALAKVPNQGSKHYRNNRKSSDEQRISISEGSAIAYIRDSFLKERSPFIMQLLQHLDSDQDAMRLFTSNKLLVAANFISSHIRLVKKERDAESELNLGFYKELMSRTSKRMVQQYIDDLNLPPQELLASLAISSPYEKTLLHLHIATKHMAKWCYTGRFDDAQVGMKVLNLHDNIRKTFKYDPVLTSTLMMYNLRASLKHSVKLVNKFCSSIFFSTCTDLLQHGGNLEDVKRFHRIVLANGLVDFTDISYDGYGLALKKLFQVYAVSADAKEPSLMENDQFVLKNNVSPEFVKRRGLTREQWLEVNYLFSFICENTLTAAKLRYLFIRTALSFSFLDIAMKLSAFLQSRQIPLGTIAINYYMQVLAACGDFKSVRYYIQFASNETQKSDLLNPPSHLEVGLDQSSLSSFLFGTELYLRKQSPHDMFNKEYKIQLGAIESIMLDLLNRVENYRLAPTLNLLQRVLELNSKCTQNPAIAFQCVNLALRVGKQQPKELQSQQLSSKHQSSKFHSSRSANNGVSSSHRRSSNLSFNPNSESELFEEYKESDFLSGESQETSLIDCASDIKKFFSDAVMQLCEPNAPLDLFHTIDHILQCGYQIEANVMNQVFDHYVAIKKYRFVIELFEILSDHNVARSIEQASAVIESLARMNRFNDCWRSISSLKPHIFKSIVRLPRGDNIQLFLRTKCLSVYASRALMQLALLSTGDDGDEGKIKLSREELIPSILSCIETITSSHSHIDFDFASSESNCQDMLILHLCLFRLHADPALVEAVFKNIRSINSRTELLVDFVTSVSEDRLPSNVHTHLNCP